MPMSKSRRDKVYTLSTLQHMYNVFGNHEEAFVWLVFTHQ